MTKDPSRGFDTIATLESRTWPEIARAMTGEADLWWMARAAIPAMVVPSLIDGSPNSLED
uniref:Uncharacterized protein n=1 Tax=Oryza rufipogon TaxID=4529 RepID=A0A0E0NID6_ORYRU